MRTCVGAGSKSRHRPFEYRIWQDSYRSGRGNGGSHWRGPAPQSARYDGLPVAEYRGHRENHLGLWEQSVAWFRRAIEANRNFPSANFNLASALAQLGQLDKARSAVMAGLALNPFFAVSPTRAVWTAMSDDKTYLTRLEPYLEGMRKAEVPEQ